MGKWKLPKLTHLGVEKDLFPLSCAPGLFSGQLFDFFVPGATALFFQCSPPSLSPLTIGPYLVTQDDNQAMC